MATNFLKYNRVFAPLYYEVRNLFNLICLANEFCNYDKIVLNDRRAGLFSLYFQAIAALQVCKWNKQSLQLNYIHGPYFDTKEKTSSWWQNYYGKYEYDFSISKKDAPKTLIIEDYEMMRRLAYAGTEMNKWRANKLIRLLVLKCEIEEAIGEYQSKNFDNAKIIGVHYRGTDKVSGKNAELERVPYEYVFQMMRKYDSITDKFFIATDEDNFLKECFSQFHNKIIFTESIRSKSNDCIHLNNLMDSPCRLGRQALIDAILLSKCDFLLRCDSNLSLASLFFNPDLASINLTASYLKTKNSF